jgi:hypothetical protein
MVCLGVDFSWFFVEVYTMLVETSLVISYVIKFHKIAFLAGLA